MKTETVYADEIFKLKFTLFIRQVVFSLFNNVLNVQECDTTIAS
jgi:hypothetical protein